MLPALFVLLFTLLIGLISFYNFYYKRRNLPPGPPPLPLIGNLHSFQRTMPEQRFLQWRHEYGDVFTFWMGETPVVCVVDYAKIMANFQKDGDAFAARHVPIEYETAIKGGVYGVIFTDGELWREQRRFTLHVLRDFGLSKDLMQERIIQELQPMFERMNEQIELGSEQNMGELLDVAVGSIINNLLFGYRFENDLGKFKEIKELLREQIQVSLHPLTAIFHLNPHFFGRLPFLSAVFDRICKHIKVINDQDWDTPSTDFVEAFLKEKAKRDASGEQHNFTMEQLNGIWIDLWAAGQETTSTTIAWGIAYLIHHPQIQTKMREELRRIDANSTRVVTVSDRSELPYTNAVICEIQRVANLVAFNLLRRLTRDVTIDGYLLKSGTAVCPQISAILMDDKIFDEPTEFRPERFLDEEGKLKRVNELIPFSIGKRQCLGESLARMELFIFVANLFKQYEFLSGAKMPSLQRKMGAAIQCPQFTCRIVRKSESVDK
uniref:Unspecific monooxygenase n=1 Tax=Globodera rostochiensis TaxID=31243 RepID=A0A914H2L1_GLORO